MARGTVTFKGRRRPPVVPSMGTDCHLGGTLQVSRAMAQSAGRCTLFFRVSCKEIQVLARTDASLLPGECPKVGDLVELVHNLVAEDFLEDVLQGHEPAD